jgi:hypothetical protein
MGLAAAGMGCGLVGGCAVVDGADTVLEVGEAGVCEVAPAVEVAVCELPPHPTSAIVARRPLWFSFPCIWARAYGQTWEWAEAPREGIGIGVSKGSEPLRHVFRRRQHD